MPDVSIVNACAIAFGAVFALLAFLAVAMQIITVVFREEETKTDPALVAALSAAVAAVIPGAKVIRIEEES